jgi:hypothetical protein
MLERATHHTRWLIHKYRGSVISPETYLGTEIIDGNCLLKEGIYEFFRLITATAGAVPFDNAHAYLGVGDSSVQENIGQTGLQATANKTYRPMSEGYPQIIEETIEGKATHALLARAVFGPDDANYAWNEFTFANGNSDAAVNANRKTQNKSTKDQGDTWVLEMQLALI